MATFMDREDELAQLEAQFEADRAGLFVLYGRRRVGKTELLRAFCQGKPHLFFVATLSSDPEQLAAFSQQIWGFGHEQVPEGFTFPAWEAAFHALADLPGRPVVVMDEFTYLIAGNAAIPSILQKLWDERLRDSQLLLILCGSYIGMIEQQVLGYRAPLYGRRSGSLYLNPLRLPAAAGFFPTYSEVERIEAWSVVGGMPHYLSLLDDRVDLPSNLRRLILSPQGALYNEPRLVLMEELRQPRNYFSILGAMAQGRTALNEIAQGSGVGSSTTVNRYLTTLRELRVVNRVVPITERQPQKSRKGLYEIEDSFLRFWFRYVHPNQSALELGLSEAVLRDRVQPTFAEYVGQALERAAREYVAARAQAGSLPFLPERVGRWWSPQGEIEVVAVNDQTGEMLAGECKWASRPVGVNVFDALVRKSAVLAKIGGWTERSYMLFSKSGFTDAMLERAAGAPVELIGPADLIRGP